MLDLDIKDYYLLTKKSVRYCNKRVYQKNQMQTVWFNDEYFLFAYNQEYSFWIEQYELLEGKLSVWGYFYGNNIDKIKNELLPQINAIPD